jgi:SAM-dependent methyltransferase
MHCTDPRGLAEAATPSIATTTLSFDHPDARPISEQDLAFLARWRCGQTQGASVHASSDSSVCSPAHVLRVWRDTKARYHVYRCVQSLSFLSPRLTRHNAYPMLLAYLTSPGATGGFLDVGCCFGQDTRAVILDGVAPDRCVVGDIHPGYWNAGLRLFGDVPLGSDACLTVGDGEADVAAGGGVSTVRTAFGDWAAPFPVPTVDAGIPDVAAPFLKSLDGAACQYVLHVLSREGVSCLLRRVAACGRPGCVLVGACVGARLPGEWALRPDGGAPRWLHSAESLQGELEAAGWVDVVVSEGAHGEGGGGGGGAIGGGGGTGGQGGAGEGDVGEVGPAIPVTVAALVDKVQLELRARLPVRP